MSTLLFINKIFSRDGQTIIQPVGREIVALFQSVRNTRNLVFVFSTTVVFSQYQTAAGIEC